MKGFRARFRLFQDVSAAPWHASLRLDKEYDWNMSKVLIIDDDRKHSELLQAYFKRFGINLVCAYDSVEGFKLLRREEPDLLLLDIMLPGKDGFEICREVRKTSNIPIIMLTARGELIDRVSGLELGAARFRHREPPSR